MRHVGPKPGPESFALHFLGHYNQPCIVIIDRLIIELEICTKTFCHQASRFSKMGQITAVLSNLIFIAQIWLCTSNSEWVQIKYENVSNTKLKNLDVTELKSLGNDEVNTPKFQSFLHESDHWNKRWSSFSGSTF